MTSRKCVGPAHPSEDDGEARRDLLGSSSSNTPSLDQLQAPDISGENDELFFRRRPGARSRFRLPIDGELSPEILEAAVAAGVAGFVIVDLHRGPPGAPCLMSRRFFFAAGGTA
jgi:hypothetical protein